MKITDGFIELVKIAGKNRIWFVDNKALFNDGNVSVSTVLESDKLKGNYIDASEFKKVFGVWKKDMHIVLEEDKCFIVHGTAKKAISIVRDTFSLPVEREKDAQYLDVEHFYSRYVEAVKYASSDETRYFLCGVLVTRNFNIVGTDGRKMICYNEKEKNVFKEDFIVPTHKLLMKIKPLSGKVYDNGMELKTSNLTYFVTFVKGQYPNYNRVIPEHSTLGNKLVFDKQAIEKLKVASKFIVEKNNGIYIDEKNFTVPDSYGDVEYQDEHGLDGWGLRDKKIFINVDYILMGVESILPEFNGKYTFNFSETDRAMTLQDKDKVVVIMPMQQKEK